jgi:hypothetical protein
MKYNLIDYISSVEKSLDHINLPNVDYFIATGNNEMRKHIMN